MRIWFTEIGEPLPVEPHARLLRYGLLTQFLATRGHQVTWWASTFSHTARQHVAHTDVETEVGGVALRLLHGPGYRRSVSLQRVRHQRHFARRFAERAASCPPPDLLVSPIPTLEVAEQAVRLGRARGFAVLTDIRDEWPEEFVDLAPRALRPLARLALWREFARAEYVCQRATGILAMSGRQLTYGLRLAGRAAGTFDGVFPLGYSLSSPEPSSVTEASAWWRAQGVDGSSAIVCFFGTIGQFFDLDTVIDAARLLRHERRVQFVLCGEGDRLDYFRRRAAGLDNVLFPGRVDRPRIYALMSAALAGLAPYAAGTRMSLPNKPFEYFAGALPVISSIQGELTVLLARHGCGITYTADSPTELCAAIRRLDDDRQAARDMGHRARALLEREFATEVVFERLEHHMASIVAPAVG